MRIKSVNKTVIEVTKQEIIDELVNNFKEFTKELGNNLDEILLQSHYLYDSLKFISESKYPEIFKDGGSLRCLPEEVFEKVEEYFFPDDEEDEFEEDEKIVSFKNVSNELKESELEIVVKDNGKIVGRISEAEIEY
jgi:hypothetical protein